MYVYGDDPGHAGADGAVPCEHHDWQHGGPVLGGCDLHDADGDGQLSGRDGQLHAGSSCWSAQYVNGGEKPSIRESFRYKTTGGQ